MLIKKITSISKYKSFVDYNWADFCKDGTREVVFNRFNVIFGENGSGKSAVCEILKDLSQHTQFECAIFDMPNGAAIEAKDDPGRSVKTYSPNRWDSQLPENSILFFDQSFIDRNIHSNGLRSADKNRHSQNSGKLIVELDEKATELKGKVKIKENEQETFENDNKDKLSQTFSEEEIRFFATNKSKTQEEVEQLKTDATRNANNAKKELERLQLLQSQVAKISQIQSTSKLQLKHELSPLKTYEEIFSRKIEDTTGVRATEELRNHIAKHKEFVETGLQILSESEQSNVCPFCRQPLTDQEEVISAYGEFFNQTYKEQRRVFLTDIDSLKHELQNLQTESSEIPSRCSSIFDQLDRIRSEFSLSELYDVTKRIELKKELDDIAKYPPALQRLTEQLENLKRLDNQPTDFTIHYSIVSEHINKISQLLERINSFLVGPDNAIQSFKTKYSEFRKITSEIENEQQALSANEWVLKFFREDKLNRQIEFEELTRQETKLREALSDNRLALRTYLREQAPEIVLKEMEVFLGHFSLEFSLVPDKAPGPTVEYPFTFRIIDKGGNERNIKTGLSEGERQLISLAFFFAINDKVPDKAKKILVFDDPITSLDASNLKILSDEIVSLIDSFSQVIVFTHHPLFFKYLSKHNKYAPQKFGIIKNVPAFGGSFIYYDPGFDTLAQLRNCHQDILQKARRTTLNVDEASLQYGQLLRLTVERFIKNELLMWDREGNFGRLTRGLKDAQSKIKLLNDGELETIEKIYNYCNYSNLLHADKEASSALSELLTHIDSLIKIMDKIRNPPPAAPATTVPVLI